MSVTKHLACRTCRKYLWIGQGDTLYVADQHLEALRQFLFFDHSGIDGKEHILLSLDEHEFGTGALAGFEEVKAQ